MNNIGLGLDRHEFECPNCHKMTEHSWAGAVVLYSSARCQHCGETFLIVENQPRLERPDPQQSH